MRRKVVGILTLGSAVVCVLSAMLVVRSVFIADSIGVSVGSIAFIAATIDGQLAMMGLDPDTTVYNSGPAASVRRDLDRMWDRMRGVRWLGIGLRTSPWWQAILPLWLVPILTAILPMRWWRRRGRDLGRGFAVEGPRGELGTDPDGKQSI